MKKGLSPAFPCVYQQTDKYGCQYTETLPGMSTRLYLAGMAMQGFLSGQDYIKTGSGTRVTIAAKSLAMADELLKQGEETR